jgi:hypothetical protein
MRFFKLRYALLGWFVARLARRRLVKMLNTAAGNSPGRGPVFVGRRRI